MVAVDGEPVERPRAALLPGQQAARGRLHAQRPARRPRDRRPGADGRALFPVGRLDVDTTGLIILTNDGVLANRLMHPRYGVPKTYVARVRGKVSQRALGTLRQGVQLEDGPRRPPRSLKKQSAKTALVEITVHEGRKRQVRRMLARRRPARGGATPATLRPAPDKGLKLGGFRQLSGDEVEALRCAGEESRSPRRTRLPLKLGASHNPAEPRSARPARAASSGLVGCAASQPQPERSHDRQPDASAPPRSDHLRPTRAMTSRAPASSRALMSERGAVDDIVSIVFTATPDLVPTSRGRGAQLGLSRTPLLCARRSPSGGVTLHPRLVHCFRPALQPRVPARGAAAALDLPE